MPKLELLASGPGTGKTTRCIDLFRQEILKSPAGIDSRSYFVLPNREHASRIQNLVLKKGVAGLFNVHILTIQDLTQRFLGAQAASRPSEALRQALLRSILEDPENRFPYFDAVKELKGFHALLSETIQEFKSALLGIDEFETRARHSSVGGQAQALLADPVFKMKVRDFSMLMRRYEEKLQARGLREPEDAISRLIAGPDGFLERPELVILDGFYHFTRAQKKLIELISARARQVVVTLTLPEKSGPRAFVFAYPESTRAFLKGLGFRETRAPAVAGRVSDEALQHLERNLFLPKPVAFTKKQASVRVFEAESSRAEMEMIAREIRRLHRETKMHWSDFCVIFRSLNGLERTLEAVFADSEIPVHVHERKKLLESALVRFLYRLVRLPLEDWKREDVFCLLRSDYWPSPAPLEQTLAFETEAVSRGLLEGRDGWLELAESLRSAPEAGAVLKRFAELEKEWLSAKSAREFSSRFLRFACCLRGTDESDEAALESVRALFKSLERSGGGAFSARAALEEVPRLLEAGLFSLKARGKNRVQVYDVVMALPKEYKTVFIGGLLEKSFPKQISEHALFKDDERRALNGKEPVLDERGARLSGEHYFFYMAASRARERLYLSYPLKDTEGRPSLPSFFVEEARACFAENSFPVTRDTGLPPDWTDWQARRPAERALAWRLFLPDLSLNAREKSALLSLGSRWAAGARFARVLEAGRRPERARLTDPRIFERVSRTQGPFSATRLETFVTCAFKHYSKYWLGLEEPPGAWRENLWMGSLLHEALFEGFSSPEARTRERLFETLERLFPKSPLAKEPLYKQKICLERMRRALARFVSREEELSKKRPFVPTHFETAFGRSVGGRAARFGPLELPGGQVRLEGAMDRVDISPDGKKALVIDYKLGSRALNEDLERGLELQLPIYLLAAKRVMGLEPLGAELRFLEKGEEAGVYVESAREELGLGPRKKLKSAEEFAALLEGTERGIVQAVARIRGGDIAVRSKSCEHCAYNPVCRFETWRLIYSEIEFGR